MKEIIVKCSQCGREQKFKPFPGKWLPVCCSSQMRPKPNTPPRSVKTMKKHNARR